MNLTDIDSILASCRLCPRQCQANRLVSAGRCGGGRLPRIALVSLHPWEEPVLTGTKGAGTVFFSGCSLGCVYCQNYEISHENQGLEVSIQRLGEIFWEQQQRGAAVLDLVTPTHYVPQIIQGLDLARQKGFSLPVVYNCSGYEKVETIEQLSGYIDVFLPDLKYFSPELSAKYSMEGDYFQIASKAIKKMVEITGRPVLSDKGILTKGVLVRHMVLPGARKDSMKLLKWLWQEFGDNIYLSLMSQYTPMYRAKESEFAPLGRRVTTFEYNSVVDYAAELGFTKCFMQERSAADAEYVPVWDGKNVLETNNL